MTTNPLRETLLALIAHQDLARAQAAGAFEAIMSGQVSEAQIAGFLVALAGKGARFMPCSLMV